MADKKILSGSPTGEPLYLSVGYLRRPHGVTGEIIMDLHTDFPDRFKAGRKIFIGEKHESHTIAAVRIHNNGLLIKIKGIDTPETVGKFRNQWVYIKRSDAAKLPEGQVYQHELYGVKVIDDSGNVLGEITEIIETGANDVYVVKNESGKEILLPAIPSVIFGLDAGARLMKVHILEGL